MRLSNQQKSHLLGRLGLILKSLNLRLLTLLRTGCMIDLCEFVIFVESLGTFVQTVSSCKLQAAKRANKPKVPTLQAQDPMVLIGKLVKALNLYSNPGVAQHFNMNNNSNARVASKNIWMQKAQSN